MSLHPLNLADSGDYLVWAFQYRLFLRGPFFCLGQVIQPDLVLFLESCRISQSVMVGLHPDTHYIQVLGRGINVMCSVLM